MLWQVLHCSSGFLWFQCYCRASYNLCLITVGCYDFILDSADFIMIMCFVLLFDHNHGVYSAHNLFLITIVYHRFYSSSQNLLLIVYFILITHFILDLHRMSKVLFYIIDAIIDYIFHFNPWLYFMPSCRFYCKNFLLQHANEFYPKFKCCVNVII